MGRIFLQVSLVLLSLGTLLSSPAAAQRVSLSDLQQQVSALAARVSTLETQNAVLEAKNAALEGLLRHVSRSGNDLFITGANLHVVHGQNNTETTNGLGNIIISYNELRENATDDRRGSHMLVVGARHSYSSYGGIVVGETNTTSNAFASGSGGAGNTASGVGASGSGGQSNTASGDAASGSGGSNRSALGVFDWRTSSLFQED